MIIDLEQMSVDPSMEDDPTVPMIQGIDTRMEDYPTVPIDQGSDTRLLAAKAIARHFLNHEPQLPSAPDGSA